MTSESMPAREPPALGRRLTLTSRSRGRWLVLASALLLAVMSTVLWAKWMDSRTRADQLQAEIKQVYAEAEGLRSQVQRAQQRIIQLERELRASSSRDGGTREPGRPKS